jgi:diadenylate cyclase
MEILRDFFQLITSMRWNDYLDIAIVALLLAKLVPLLRGTNTFRVLFVVLGIVVVSWVTSALKLHALNFIVESFLQVGFIALIILFQPELRRMLDHLGSVRLEKIFSPEKVAEDMRPMIRQTVQACEIMSREKIGALIVFARENRMDEYYKTGTMIDARLSEQLIRNIFFPKAALHDGAMIVVNGRVMAAGCVLPLSESVHLNADLGTRHRAGVGMSEASDAVIVIVSEETGTISVAVGGMLKRHLAPQTLERLLIQDLCPTESQIPDNLALKLKQKLHIKDKEDKK